VAVYTRLLEHPSVQMPPAQRESIMQVRDRLTHRLETMSSASRPAGCIGGSVDGTMVRAQVAGPPAAIGNGDAADHRPKVSVVTACCNAQRYLKECVDSIQGQTMADWELFLIDDGSTDDTRRMIEEYTRQDTRIRSHGFSDSRGLFVRRNFAINRAASDFIVIQDADDIMSPMKLERLYREINRDRSLVMVGSYHRTFLEEFRGIEHTEPNDLPVDHETIVALCTSWRTGIHHGTAIIRKDLFDTIGCYDENPFAADAFWSAKLALYSQIGARVTMANIPEYLTFVRVQAGSRTQAQAPFDSHVRRERYRRYCECGLQRIREKWRRQAPLDVAAELRHCNGSDFLVRFKARITEWESRTVSPRLGVTP
jgi:GT2 family glycosyltransferase